MDEAQVRALVESMLGAVKTELTDTMHQANQGLAANLSKQIAKLDTKPKGKVEQADDPAGSESASFKALQTQLQELQKTLEAEKQSAFAASSNAALTDAIAQAGTTSPQVLKKLLQAEYSGKLVKDGDRWFVSEGENTVGLSDAVKTFLATDDGKLFLPPSGTKGVGNTETQAIAGGTNSQSLSQQLEAAFKVAK